MFDKENAIIEKRTMEGMRKLRFRKLAWDTLSESELVRLVLVEDGYSLQQNNLESFLKENTKFELIAFYDGDRIIGFALVTPAYCRDVRCICIEKMRYGWEYNTEEKIGQMICGVARVYSADGKEYVVMNVSKRHEMNLELYQEIGFRKAIIPSPKGKEYCILFDSVARLSGCFVE